MARQFGIISSSDGGVSGCILNAVKRETSAQSAEARDAQGAVTDKWYYSREQKVTLSGVMDSTDLSVKAGDSLRLCYFVTKLGKHALQVSAGLEFLISRFGVIPNILFGSVYQLRMLINRLYQLIHSPISVSCHYNNYIYFNRNCQILSY